MQKDTTSLSLISTSHLLVSDAQMYLGWDLAQLIAVEND